MNCESVRPLLPLSDRDLEPSEREALSGHLAACPACRELREASRSLAAGILAAGQALESGVPDPGFLEPARPAFRRWAWAAAAAGLLASVPLLRRALQPPVPEALPTGPSRPAEAASRHRFTDGGTLEQAPGCVLRAEGGRLHLDSGTCWVRTTAPVEFLAPVPLRIEAGSSVELTAAVAPARMEELLLRPSAAGAGDGGTLEVVVHAGSVRAPGLFLPPGSVGLFRPGRPPVLVPATEEDALKTQAWRAERLARAASRTLDPRQLAAAGAALSGDGSFARLDPSGWIRVPSPGAETALTAEVRTSGAHLAIRYPLGAGCGEAVLGSLSALEGPDWHRLSLRSGPDGAEIFLDGRRLFHAAPRAVRDGLPGLLAIGTQGAPLEIRSLGVGMD